MASTYLSRAATANNNSVGKWTFSCWVKRNKITSEANLISFYSDTNYRSALRFDGDDKLRFYEFYAGSTIVAKVTNQLFRDTSAWYHIVFAVDKTVSTPDTQIYINGVATTSWSTNDDYTQNENGKFDDAETLEINAQNAGGIGDCEMAHVHFCDGTTYQASDFGETDSTSGVWKPKTAPSVTYGTNGFFLEFANSASLGTDSSGNGNNFTVNGSGTQTLDTPSNVYATLNALKKLTGTLSNGNLTWLANGDNGVWSTIGANKGKWYWETQVNADPIMMGIASENVQQTTDRSTNTGVYGMQNGTTYGFYRNNGTSGQSTGFPQVAAGSSVINHALDLDNGKYFMGVDGVYKDLSGTASDAAAGTNPTFSSIDTNLFWFPFVECRGTSASCDVNFGNGYFGTTAISSPNSDGAGEGKFAYAPPTGYYALNTKNIKTYG